MLRQSRSHCQVDRNLAKNIRLRCINSSIKLASGWHFALQPPQNKKPPRRVASCISSSLSGDWIFRSVDQQLNLSGTALLPWNPSVPSRWKNRPGSPSSRRRSNLRPLPAGVTRRCSPCRVLQILALAPCSHSASCLRHWRMRGRTGRC